MCLYKLTDRPQALKQRYDPSITAHRRGQTLDLKANHEAGVPCDRRYSFHSFAAFDNESAHAEQEQESIS